MGTYHRHLQEELGRSRQLGQGHGAGPHPQGLGLMRSSFWAVRLCSKGSSGDTGGLTPAELHGRQGGSPSTA